MHKKIEWNKKKNKKKFIDAYDHHQRWDHWAIFLSFIIFPIFQIHQNTTFK